MRTHRATPKSIRTRTAIENAARELFAADGCDGTTVRAIAARANIDASMIIAYYGSKDALFALVTKLQPPDLNSVKPSETGKALMRLFLDQWEDTDGGAGFLVLLRSAATNQQSADKLRDIFHAQLLPLIARLGSRETASVRAGLVASQLLGFALARYVLRVQPVVDMPRETIIHAIGNTLQRYATSTA